MVHSKRKALEDITAVALSGSQPFRAAYDTGGKHKDGKATFRRLYSTRSCPNVEINCPVPASSKVKDDKDSDADLHLACKEALAMEEISGSPDRRSTEPVALPSSASQSSDSEVNAGLEHHLSDATSFPFSSSLSSSTLPVGIIDIDETQGSSQHPRSHLLPHQVGKASHKLSDNVIVPRSSNLALTDGTPQRLASYSRDYFAYLREREREQQDRPLPDYMSRIQGGALTQDMRALLVDWLVTVCEECELMPSTLYHCVELIDRALSKLQVPKEQLQCMGCACLFIACKFEETTVPSLEEFTYMAAESFSKKQLTDLELRVVEALSFRLSTVTAYNFLSRFTLAAGSGPRETALVYYFSELSLLHYEFLGFSPSIRAAAALYLARQTLAVSNTDSARRAAEERNIWTPTIAFYTGYSPATTLPLQECARLLRRAHAGVEYSPYEALKLKYGAPALLHVGDIACVEEIDLGATILNLN
ncbi:hypothetical protein NSK_003849 [Nannochloropsis salina CCMP1776]|uniref:Cyclin N-terminal domain-containing protein n=1 Tax=Nannochloropsis salina CCMP1776 TaxID=1027361 RepID=A0A4D9D353_9STRA|nr:hypothetical protein NSK_003849 [Nannochloropsis salina CCMP1776]|eukprot:TFJ84817.1 hypothetical protein NSK_003849 [Nannochloropsis salina CCMP1776]